MISQADRPTAVPAFNDALTAFIAATQERIAKRFAEHYPRLTVPTLTAERGLKNVRIVSSDGASRYVFCFVRIADGAVLKAAGWKAPAKHARGSIYVNAGQDAVSEYGANYLR